MVSVSKIEIAYQHVRTALKLIALNSHAYSVHVLVMAADELIRSVAKHEGLTLQLEIEAYIKPDRLKEYREAKNWAYNFFKHADRDPGAKFDRSPEDIAHLTDVILVQACLHLRDFGYKDAALNFFASGYAILNPDMIDRERTSKEAPDMLQAYDDLNGKLSRETLLDSLLAVFVRDGEIDPHQIEVAASAAPHVPQVS